MDSYAREAERYGGPDTIDALERVFAVNSAALSEIVAALYTGEITLHPLVVAVVTLDHFFTLWGLDLPARLKYIQSLTERYAFVDDFRAQRRLLCELVQPWDPAYDPAIMVQGQRLLQVSAIQEQVVKQVAQEVRALAEKGLVWVEEEQLLGSLAHMHINRLLGLKREQEQKVYAFWRHTLESIQKRPARKGEKAYAVKSV